MDVSLRVAERFLLASRVAERTKRGDSIGDPRELLAKYQQILTHYASMEHTALDLKVKYEKLFKLKEQHPENIEELKAIRDTIPSGGEDSPTSVRVQLVHYGFTKLSETARLLCLALLQQFSLPPKTRKAIEAASKFWMRNPRLNAKGKGMEDIYANGVEMYLEYLADFRKYEKLFEQAIGEGKLHADTGELVTKYKAGPFVCINTGGFDPKVMEDKARLCEEAAKKMESIGLGKVCYGDVLVTNRLSGESTQAFYLPAKDEMFVRADAKVSLDTVRVVCHELTHRLEDKFLQGKKQDIIGLYRTINTQSIIGDNISYKDFPKNGEQVEVPKAGLCEVVDTDFRRKSVKVKPVSPPPEEERMRYTMPLEVYNKYKGIAPPPKNPLNFITGYAKRGGPGENFAEMVSFYAIGQLPKEQVELLLPIIS